MEGDGHRVERVIHFIAPSYLEFVCDGSNKVDFET